MPSTSEVGSVVRARVSNPQGVGEPPGEPAPPPGILGAMGDDLRSKLPDELVDELLAGASSEEEIVGPGGLLSQLTKRLVEWATPATGRCPRRSQRSMGRSRSAPRAIGTGALSRRS